MTAERASLEVGPAHAGRRVDAFVAERGLGLTRSQAERLAKAGQVRINGRPAPAGRRVAPGEVVEVLLPPREQQEPMPETIPLDILFEDDHVIVVNKPRGMVVHPGAGRVSGTLVNALLAHTRALAPGGGSHRPGIVHRLDRDTSGLLVVAKTDQAHGNLSRQVRRREVERRYLAFVWGTLLEDRLVVQVPIGRHLRDRKRMAAIAQPGEGRKVREARTDVSVIERLGPVTVVEARLSTGRTHQIRVHLAHVGHPVVGDPTYGLRLARRLTTGRDGQTQAALSGLRGQALHAHALRFRHPVGGQEMSFVTPLPRDMAELRLRLAEAAREKGGSSAGSKKVAPAGMP